MNGTVEKLGQVAGHWAVILAGDLPSPEQLDDFENQGWIAFQIIPAPAESSQMGAANIAIYLRHKSAHS